MPSFGIITSTIASIRSDNTEESLLLSQALFGELFSIISFSESYVRIKLDFDGSEGWVNENMLTPLDDETYIKLKDSRCFVIDKLIELQLDNLIYPLRLVPGSEIHMNGEIGNQMRIGKHLYNLKQRVSTPIYGNVRHSIITRALEFMNAPFLQGGRSLFGIDSPGLTQIVCKLNGITLPREASKQMSVGRIIKKMEQAMIGDLAFFSGKDGIVNHVGIIHEKQKIIHVWGSVRIDDFDERGILDIETGELSHKLLYIKNIVD